jgi:hypothetical protein
MTLRRHLSRIANWWRSVHPSKALERAIPAYRDAAGRERRARQRNDTRSIGQAVAARKAALHAALRGRS